MPRRSTRTTLSQASSSSTSQSLSQSRIEEHFAPSQVNLDEQINNVVRYFVNNAGQNVYFRRADIQKYCVSKAGQHFQRVFDNATSILKNVYGYNVLVCDPTANSTKAYIVSNALPYKNYRVDADETQTKDVQKIVLLLILSHIFMSNGPVSDASLYSFLKSFDIDVNVRHSLFGLVKDYITALIKHKFLASQIDDATKKTMFSWGIRAEKEVSKLEILKFVCKMYRNRQPTAWGPQYTAACEQGFENERIDEQHAMDLDEE